MTLWFHTKCAALRRPGAFEEVLAHEAIDSEAFRPLVENGLAHYRLDRITGIERAASGRAKCRECRETIAKGEWRIPLVFFEEGMFNTAGFVHLSCAKDYFGTTDILEWLSHFSPDLTNEDLKEVSGVLARL